MQYRKYQEQLIGLAKAQFRNKEQLSDQVIDAFYEVPRHQFVERYRHYGTKEWLDITDGNIEEHLGTLYANHPLVLLGSDEAFRAKYGSEPVSTISQPAFVLRLLDLLDLRKGHNVFELGAGSGWTAALLGHLVGPSGKVSTSEIITELAEKAQVRLTSLGFNNVTVLCGDGGDGLADCAPFDRVIFTAGAFDIPFAFHQQIKEGGLLLFVLKNKGGADNLLLLKKHPEYFETIYAFPCGFVPVTGKHHIPEMEERDLDDYLHMRGLEEAPTSRTQFWWGSGSKGNFLWETAALRSFLSLYQNFEPIYTDIENDKGLFGWWNAESNSFALARPGELVNFGNEEASTQLITYIKDWVNWGMPTLSNLDLRIYPADSALTIPDSAWVSRRRSSLFVWTLPKKFST